MPRWSHPYSRWHTALARSPPSRESRPRRSSNICARRARISGRAICSDARFLSASLISAAGHYPAKKRWSPDIRKDPTDDLNMGMQTASQTGLIDQLEEVLSNKDLGRRAEVLRRVTDLFVLHSATYSEEQIALFDTVMRRLLEEIERAARAQFGSRMATIPDAPRGIIRLLARDSDIEVAGPVLTHSERLDTDVLVEHAKSQSQDHLLAIARRKVLTEPVTDVLVARGNPAVLSATAGNSGANFSQFGVSTLVK